MTIRKGVPNTKTFDGKRYHYVVAAGTKRLALGRAESYHEQGYRVRTVKIAGFRGYFIYINGLGYH